MKKRLLLLLMLSTLFVGINTSCGDNGVPLKPDIEANYLTISTENNMEFNITDNEYIQDILDKLPDVNLTEREAGYHYAAKMTSCSSGEIITVEDKLESTFTYKYSFSFYSEKPGTDNNSSVESFNVYADNYYASKNTVNYEPAKIETGLFEISLFDIVCEYIANCLKTATSLNIAMNMNIDLFAALSPIQSSIEAENLTKFEEQLPGGYSEATIDENYANKIYVYQDTIYLDSPFGYLVLSNKLENVDAIYAQFSKEDFLLSHSFNQLRYEENESCLDLENLEPFKELVETATFNRTVENYNYDFENISFQSPHFIYSNRTSEIAFYLFNKHYIYSLDQNILNKAIKSARLEAFSSLLSNDDLDIKKGGNRITLTSEQVNEFKNMYSVSNESIIDTNEVAYTSSDIHLSSEGSYSNSLNFILTGNKLYLSDGSNYDETKHYSYITISNELKDYINLLAE